MIPRRASKSSLWNFWLKLLSKKHFGSKHNVAQSCWWSSFLPTDTAHRKIKPMQMTAKPREGERVQQTSLECLRPAATRTSFAPRYMRQEVLLPAFYPLKLVWFEDVPFAAAWHLATTAPLWWRAIIHRNSTLSCLFSCHFNSTPLIFEMGLTS